MVARLPCWLLVTATADACDARSAIKGYIFPLHTTSTLVHFAASALTRSPTLLYFGQVGYRVLVRCHDTREEQFANLTIIRSARFAPLADNWSLACCPIPIMEGIQTHPSSAAQAKAFTAPGSLSFPGAGNDLSASQANGENGQKPAPNGQQPQQGNGNGNANGQPPATPAATPAANQGPSGITPTLQ